MIIRQTTTIVFEYPQDYLQEQEWCKTKGERWIHKSTSTLGAVYENTILYSIGQPNSSEKPNNCEHITEDGVTCAKYPACDDCLDNPLNKVKGSERLVKGSEQTEPTISKMEQVDEPQMGDAKPIPLSNRVTHIKDEPQTETEIAKAIVHKMIDDAVIAEDAYPDLRQKMHDAVDEYEPHTVDLGNGFSITANGTKTPNYCATCKYKDTPFDDLPCDMCKSYSAYEPKTEPTISKIEQVDKDINVRSKDEPQTNKDFKVTYTCSFTDCKNFGFNEKCIECKRKQSEARLEDEPQTDCLTCRYNSDEWDSPKCDGCSKAYSNYEPQTDCAWR